MNKIVELLKSVESTADLKKYDLKLSDYNSACCIVSLLSEGKSVEFIQENVYNFFKKYGSKNLVLNKIDLGFKAVLMED